MNTNLHIETEQLKLEVVKYQNLLTSEREARDKEKRVLDEEKSLLSNQLTLTKQESAQVCN